MTSDDLMLGVHSGHDANVTVMDSSGRVLFAAGEERFNREKMFAGFPSKALSHVVNRFGSRYRFMALPRLGKAEKIIRELQFFYHSFQKGLAAPRLLIWAQNSIGKVFRGRGTEKGFQTHQLRITAPHVNVEHHLAHAASAFYPSGFETAYILTLDGEGDGYSCCLFEADRNGLKRKKAWFHNEMTVGRDYEKVTAMLGFHPIRHPGKITGLAAYGHYDPECIDELKQFLDSSWKSARSKILATSTTYQIISESGRRELIDVRNTIFRRFSREDMAYAIQHILEERVLGLVKQYIPEPAGSNIALAGGVFANVTLNKKIKNLGFNSIFIQPAMTDCGLSMGALLNTAPFRSQMDGIGNVYFGPEYHPDEIRSALDTAGLKYREPSDLPFAAAELLAAGHVIARFDGAMEFGPRALGNRSILYHAGDPSVNDWLNKQLKRSEFMPFAPVTLAQYAPDRYIGYKGAERTSKFMTMTFDCSPLMKKESPAVVHLDGTARPQILSSEDNPGYAAILEQYYRMTGIPTLVNTSFNMHEEPIVMTPEDAIRAYEASHLDALIAGPFLVERGDIPE